MKNTFVEKSLFKVIRSFDKVEYYVCKNMSDIPDFDQPCTKLIEGISDNCKVSALSTSYSYFDDRVTDAELALNNILRLIKEDRSISINTSGNIRTEALVYYKKFKDAKISDTFLC